LQLEIKEQEKISPNTEKTELAHIEKCWNAIFLQAFPTDASSLGCNNSNAYQENSTKIPIIPELSRH